MERKVVYMVRRSLCELNHTAITTRRKAFFIAGTADFAGSFKEGTTHVALFDTSACTIVPKLVRRRMKLNMVALEESLVALRDLIPHEANLRAADGPSTSSAPYLSLRDL